MAGERLLSMLNSRGGSPSDYADVVFGIVDSVSPLKITISNNMILDDSFIDLGKNITKLKREVKIDGEKKEIEIDNRLKKGDKVTLFRQDGGQSFYLFEREDG